jgi:sterol desaturase/sphingolipid hydroxylase (fatty acid hydroxylase superfamily)
MGEKSTAGIVIGFLILAVGFFIVERISPGIKGQPVKRRGFWTDVIYWFFTPLVTKWFTRLALIIPAVILIGVMGVSVEELRTQKYHGMGPLSRQSLWLQGLEVFILGDFVGYWTHRLFHTGRWWPFHAVHHSSEAVDWLSSVRLHPVNDVVTKLGQVFPLLLLGFNPFVLIAYTPIITLYAIILHDNVNWSYGPLRSIIASPVFHRWHHTREQEGLDKNFAGFFPLWDILFGTYYMPKDRLPTEFGIHEPMPENILVQLTHPFRQPKRDAKPG